MNHCKTRSLSGIELCAGKDWEKAKRMDGNEQMKTMPNQQTQATTLRSRSWRLSLAKAVAGEHERLGMLAIIVRKTNAIVHQQLTTAESTPWSASKLAADMFHNGGAAA